MSQKIGVASPEAIRERLYPDLEKYMRLSESEREEYDARWKVYVERALYVLLTNGKLDYLPSDIEGLSRGDVAWLNRMAGYVVSRRHQFEQPIPFGRCLSDRQFESVIRNRDGGERISRFSDVLSELAYARGQAYNERTESKQAEETADSDRTASGSPAPEVNDEAFGQVIASSRRTRARKRN